MLKLKFHLSKRMTDFNTDKSVILPPRYIVDVARRMQKKNYVFMTLCLKEKTVIISKKATKNTKTNIFEKFLLKNLLISNLMLTFVS